METIITYKPLFDTLKTKNIKMSELRKKTGIAPNTMTKIRKNQEVAMPILNRICAELDVNYNDIVLYVKDEPMDTKERG